MQIEARPELSDLIAKVEAAERLTREEGYRLLRSADLMTVGYIADRVRRRLVGDEAYFTTEPEHASGEGSYTIAYDRTHSVEEVVGRILAVRDLQEETGRILCARVEPVGVTSGVADMKVLAVVRILLDNVQHVRSQQSAMGLKMAQATLSFGVDDLGVFNEEEVPEIAYLIRQAGRTPIQCDHQYNSVKTWA